MRLLQRSPLRSPRPLLLALVLGVVGLPTTPLSGQDRGSPEGEWRYQSGDAWGTRFQPADQIDAENFEDLELAWLWRGDNYGPEVDYQFKSTPTYVDGILYTVAGTRRQVIAIDPGTGETLWTYREPHTTRWERSMRQNYGKGVAYGEIDGRGVIYYTSPAFFLHALDAKTGRHLEDWGEAVPLEGFPESGVIDMLPDLLEDWGPWQDHVAAGGEYDPDYGIPRELGFITTSSPPIVVNGTVVVGNSAEQGYNQTRIENVPGDILGYDAASGEHEWKFHVIPRPGEFGHDTWENDAWQWTGDISSWAPMSADEELGLVYIPTNPPTIDYYAGFSPGANLYGTSVIALDAETGERRWHFQTVHSDQWNYDLPNVPILANLTVDGEEIPAAIQTTKQGFIFAFNRETGEPIWPIEERPVLQTEVPGNWTSPTQPFPTRPEPMEPMSVTEDNVIDFTDELKQQALEIVAQHRVGGPYMPRLPIGYEGPHNFRCSGGLNITNPATLDPTTGILYASSSRGCSGGYVEPGAENDEPDNPQTTGTTISEWVAGQGRGLQGPEGLPIFKPPYRRLSAYDMNTGERIWWIPTGMPPESVRNHPATQGMDYSEMGGGSPTIQMVVGDLLVTASRRTAETPPMLTAYDKLTGEQLGQVELPASGQYGMMSYVHEGRQFIVVQVGDGGQHPGSLAAFALP